MEKTYSHDDAIKRYKKIKKKEWTNRLPKIEPSGFIIVRLDGKGLTKKFLRKKLVADEHFLAMKQVLAQIVKYCPYIEFAYSSNDEISFIINNSQLNSNVIKCKTEKLLSYLSGFVSSLYTIYINTTGKQQAYSFDARLIPVSKDLLKEYFCCRQQIAIGYFIEKLCTHNKLEKKAYTLHQIDSALHSVGDNWANYPEYIPYGFIGHYDEKRVWQVEVAKDFEMHWSAYAHGSLK